MFLPLCRQEPTRPMFGASARRRYAAYLAKPTTAMPSEFDLIRRYFRWPTRHTDLGGGDDAALLCPQPGHQLVASTDMLVSGRHFFANAEPRALGWKTLAVNLSDMAAMGAVPRWALLSLALPSAQDEWLSAFANGLHACADRHGVDLVGGDTTRGPLTLNVSMIGEVPTGQAITRAGADIGDTVWVSGQPGRAALGLWHLRDGLRLTDAQRQVCLDALHHPTPRVDLGIALRGIASAMLDVSDGLLADLDHILTASATGARLNTPALPLATLVDSCDDPDLALQACLSGGDDYELLFTAPPDRHGAVLDAARQAGVAVHSIGQIMPPEEGLSVAGEDGIGRPAEALGFDHFADPT